MGYVFACRFQRQENGKWEMGFIINEQTVIDKNGNIPSEIWNYKSIPSMGSFQLPTDS